MEQKDILKCINGTRPQTILLSGSPGAGKTTFLEAFAHHWSREHENFMTNPDGNPRPEHTIVVYAPATDLKGDVWTSIDRYVCCNDEEERKQISKHLKRDRSSAILLDALDEIRDPEILSNVKKFIENNNKNGGPQILVSARTGLSRLPNKFIDRSLQLEGYTPEQGLKYIEVFIGNHLKQGEEEKIEHPLCKQQIPSISMNMYQIQGSATEGRRLFQPSEVHGYMLDHKKEMNAILCNPLTVHITCGLAVEGVLKLDKDNTLKPLYLQKCLEEFILKRETRGNVFPLEDRLGFYRLCLHGLLTGIQSFTQIDLETFNVPSDSPYMAFFNTSEKPDDFANNVKYHSFVHETFYEYFAVRCFEELPDDHKRAAILSVCTKDVLQNVRKIICQMLHQYEIKDMLLLAKGIIRTMLLVLKPHDTKFEEDPLELKEDIQNNVPDISDLLLHRNIDTERFTIKVENIWEKINTQFIEPNDEMKVYWEKVLTSQSEDVGHHVLECLKEFSEKEQLDIKADSIYKLLPHER